MSTIDDSEYQAEISAFMRRLGPAAATRKRSLLERNPRFAAFTLTLLAMAAFTLLWAGRALLG